MDDLTRKMSLKPGKPETPMSTSRSTQQDCNRHHDLVCTVCEDLVFHTPVEARKDYKYTLLLGGVMLDLLCNNPDDQKISLKHLEVEPFGACSRHAPEMTT